MVFGSLEKFLKDFGERREKEDEKVSERERKWSFTKKGEELEDFKYEIVYRSLWICCSISFYPVFTIKFMMWHAHL